MARVQMGVRVTEAAAAKVDALEKEFNASRADVLRAVLSEALSNQNVVMAVRARLKKAML